MKRKWIKEMKRSLMKRKWIKEMKRSQILRIVLGGQLLISTLKLFWEGGEGGGDPYTNQHPTLFTMYLQGGPQPVLNGGYITPMHGLNSVARNRLLFARFVFKQMPWALYKLIPRPRFGDPLFFKPSKFHRFPFGNSSSWWLWSNPLEKICSSNWIISPIFGVKT